MYLRQLVIQNDGPLQKFTLEPSFRNDGSPRPVVLVGSNGSGKTTVLSVIADAMIELAASQFSDVAPPMGVGHRYFRMLGSITTRQGAEYQFDGVRFFDATGDRRVVSKSGTMDAETAAQISQIFPELHQIADGNAKVISQPQIQLEQTFRSGVYSYFPCSRSEQPNWSTESTDDEVADFNSIISNNLRKPIVIEHAFDRIKPWIVDLILDSAVDGAYILTSSNLDELKVQIHTQWLPPVSLNNLNQILRQILGDNEVHIIRSNRFQGARKIQIARAGVPVTRCGCSWITHQITHT